MPGETNIENKPNYLPPEEEAGLSEETDQEVIHKIQQEVDKINTEENHQYSLFVVHEDSGKVEILEKVQPGVVSYAFDPMRVTPRDIRYMLEAVFDAAGISGPDDVKFLLLPLEGFKQAIVVLDIKNRSNIEIGTMELWRYSR